MLPRVSAASPGVVVVYNLLELYFLQNPRVPANRVEVLVKQYSRDFESYLSHRNTQTLALREIGRILRLIDRSYWQQQDYAYEQLVSGEIPDQSKQK